LPRTRATRATARMVTTATLTSPAGAKVSYRCIRPFNSSNAITILP
jgi:hypothetical protein